MIELLAVIALIGIVTVLAGTTTMRMYRRYQLTSVTQEVQSLMLATRMNAVKRNANTILFFDIPNYRVYSWADPDRNFVREPDEPIINDFAVPPNIDVRVAFDQYNGNAGLVHMVVFQGDGTLVAPGAAYATAGNQVGHADPEVDCGGGCRGVFLANRNILYPAGTPSPLDVFRLSVDQAGSGKVSRLKLRAGSSTYVPGPPWVWYD